MATANFSVINASKYYVFDDYTKDEDDKDVLRDWDDWYILDDDIQYMGTLSGFTPISRDNEEWRNRYGIDTPLLDKEYQNKYYNFSAGIGLNSGYYSGACFDFDISVCPSAGERFVLSDHRDMQEFSEVLAEDLLEWGELSDWNPGLKVMNRKKIEAYLFKELQKVAEDCEKFMAENCEGIYKCVGHLDTGSALYEKVVA